MERPFNVYKTRDGICRGDDGIILESVRSQVRVAWIVRSDAIYPLVDSSREVVMNGVSNERVPDRRRPRFQFH